MSSSQAPYRGAVQAQGDDITKKGGYTRSWAEDKPVTDEEGLSFLAKIENECSDSQKAERKQAFVKARNFVKRASPEILNSEQGANYYQGFMDNYPPY
jgi:hypothetical protein